MIEFLRRQGSAPPWPSLATVMLAGLATARLAVADDSEGPFIDILPDCGDPGAVALVQGSGWDTKSADFTIEVFFDDISVVSPFEPDNIYGFFDAPFVVPIDAVGGFHIVKVLATGPNNRSQCLEVLYCVAPKTTDPWTIGIDPASGGRKMLLYFDPQDVCSMGRCDEIRFVQALQRTGRTSSGSTRLVSHGEIGWPDSVDRIAQTTSDGYRLDCQLSAESPFYQYGSDWDQGYKASCVSKLEAFAYDTPNYDIIPNDVDSVIAHYDIAAYCVSGYYKGRWLGSASWEYKRYRVAPFPAPPTVHLLVPSTGSTSPPPADSGLVRAMNLFCSLRNCNLPPADQIAKDGVPCSQ